MCVCMFVCDGKRAFSLLLRFSAFGGVVCLCDGKFDACFAGLKLIHDKDELVVFISW